MAEKSKISVTDIHENWSRFVQSPAQLAYSRLTKFPPQSGSRLIDVLDLSEDEQILEIGCGMGILASRLLETGITSTIWACELDNNYLHTTLPTELKPRKKPIHFQATGFELPVSSNSVDRVLTHTLVNLLSGEDWKRLHGEVRRVLTPSGDVTHMDGIGGDSWTPTSLDPRDEERNRNREFFRILKETHNNLGTGFVNTVRNLPEHFRKSNFNQISVDVYSTALRLSDSQWNENKVKLYLELRQRAERDRVERLRNLLEATGEMNSERAQLFRQCISDAQQQALRRRKALENNRELGWQSSTTLVVSAH